MGHNTLLNSEQTNKERWLLHKTACGTILKPSDLYNEDTTKNNNHNNTTPHGPFVQDFSCLEIFCRELAGVGLAEVAHQLEPRLGV